MESERRLQIGGENYFISNAPSHKYETNHLEPHFSINMNADNSLDKNKVRSNTSQGYQKNKKPKHLMLKKHVISETQLQGHQR